MKGWLCKVLASLFALLCVNADEQSRYRSMVRRKV